MPETFLRITHFWTPSFDQTTVLLVRCPSEGQGRKIYACYKIKGKPRGALRVVKSRKARCRRGERKVAWTVAGATGQPGSQGAHGSQGEPGASTAQQSVSTGALLDQIDLLAARIESLEAKLSAVQGLCDQALALAKQVNLLGTEVGELVTILTGTILGAIFGSVKVSTPLKLEEFGCSVL